MELSDALDNIAGQRLKGTQRLLVLEELRPAVLESIGLLKRQFAGSSLPLPGLKARAAQYGETFQLDMAAAYRKAAAEICAPNGKIPMLRGASVIKALQRSAWHYCQAAEFAWHLYRAPAAGVWQGLHRVYRFSAELRIEARLPEDAASGNLETIQGLYVQALLMSIAHPLAYSQAEQAILWQLARSFSGFCTLQHPPQYADAACVPEDADQGPGQRLDEEADPLWLDLRAYSEEVTRALSRVNDGHAEVFPGRNMAIQVSAGMLQRLNRSFGMAAARLQKRRLAGHTLQTVFGLSAVHFYLAGRRDFDSFVRYAAQHEVHGHPRASWAMVGTDASKVPLYPARALDQSLGGYRLSWDQAQNIRARVGELIGINLSEDGGDPDWMLGIIRWLRFEPGDALAAGVELLSRRTIAIGLRIGVNETMAPVKPPIRAVALESMDPVNSSDTQETYSELSYLVAGDLPGGSAWAEIVHPDEGRPEHLPEGVTADFERALNFGDYMLFKPVVSQPVALVMVAADQVLEAVAPMDAFAEPDAPLLQEAEFADSYELIDPDADVDALTPDEHRSTGGDDLR